MHACAFISSLHTHAALLIICEKGRPQTRITVPTYTQLLENCMFFSTSIRSLQQRHTPCCRIYNCDLVRRTADLVDGAVGTVVYPNPECTALLYPNSECDRLRSTRTQYGLRMSQYEHMAKVRICPAPVVF